MLRLRSVFARMLRGGILALSLAGLASVAAHASAWNQLPGQGIAITTGTFLTGSQSFNRSGQLIRSDSFTKEQGATYVEYGLWDWLELIARPELVSIHAGGSPGERYTGFGTSALGAQAQVLIFGPRRLAVQGTLQVPAITREANLALIGNTSRNADARVLLGSTFAIGPWPSFVNAEAAYRMRGAGAPDEVHLDLTLGTRPLPRVLVLLQSFTTVPTGPGTAFFPRSTFSNLELSGVYDLDRRWSVQLGLFETIDGRDALRERGLDVAVWYRF